MPTVSHVQEATFSASKKKPLLRHNNETSVTRRLDQQAHTGLLGSAGIGHYDEDIYQPTPNRSTATLTYFDLLLHFEAA